MTSPMYSSGVTTSISIIGSSSLIPADLAAACSAIDPAIRKAISLESTAWDDPSVSVALMSTSGYPARSRHRGHLDALLDGRDVLTGNVAALDLVHELEPAAGGKRLEVDDDVAEHAGTAGLALQLAVDLRHGASTVSRYATWGRPTLASTLNSRSSRRAITSRWSSPIPEMIVWPVSSSDRTWKVGSSSARRARPFRACPGRSWSWARWQPRSPDRGTSSTRAESGRCCRKGVAGPGVLEPDRGHDVTRVDLVDVLLLGGVHPQESPEALLLGVGGVDDGVALAAVAA